MSSLTLNICQYNCGRRFDSLHDLIIHIEATHIDFDPSVIQETENANLSSLPFSYVLRYSTEQEVAAAQFADSLNYCDYNQPSYVYKPQPEIEEQGISQTQLSETPWYRLETGASKRRASQVVQQQEEPPPPVLPPKEAKLKAKRFVCPVSGCTKSYKNQNGMKYHIMNYHDMNGNFIKPKKEYKCNYCEKEYKTFRGFHSHVMSHKEMIASASASTANPLPPTPYMHHRQCHQQPPKPPPKVKHGYLPASETAGMYNPSKAMHKKLYGCPPETSSAPASAEMAANMPSTSRSSTPSYMLDEVTYPMDRHPYLDLEQGNPHALMQPSLASNMLLQKQQQQYEEYYNLASRRAWTYENQPQRHGMPMKKMPHYANLEGNVAHGYEQMEAAAAMGTMNSLHNHHVNMYMEQQQHHHHHHRHANEHLLTHVQQLQQQAYALQQQRQHAGFSGTPEENSDAYFDQHGNHNLSAQMQPYTDMEPNVSS